MQLSLTIKFYRISSKKNVKKAVKPFKSIWTVYDNALNADLNQMWKRVPTSLNVLLLWNRHTWVNSSLVIKPSRFLSKSLKAVSAFEALSDLLITSTLTQLSNIFKDRFLKSLFRVCCLSLECAHQKCPVFLPCYLCLFSVDFIGSLTDFVFALSKILLLVHQTVTVFSEHCTDLPQS